MWQDIRYSFRLLSKNKAVTIVCIVSLALCIGAITAIYSVVDAVILRPFPYPKSEELAALWNSYPGLEQASVSPPEFADYRDLFTSASELSAFTDANRNLTGNGEPERLQAFLVSPNLFRLLRVRPELGRDFVSADGVDGKNQVVLLSHDLWKRRFGQDRSIIGKPIHLDAKPYIVIGILPEGIRFPDAPGFKFSDRADLWIPFSWEQIRKTESRGNQYLSVLVRLKSGISLEKAQAELDQIGSAFRKTDPNRYISRWNPLLISFEEQINGEVRPALWLLFASAGLVLLIACTNVAHLKLAQSSDRRRETAVRMALGAGLAQLMRQYMIEGVFLSIISGSFGSVLAFWAVRMIVRMAPTNIPRIETVGINASVLLFAILVSFMVGILFALIPALQRAESQDLKNTVGTLIHQRYQRVLMTMEVAFAVVVLISASLLWKSFRGLQEIDPGWKAEKVLTFYVPLPRDKYSDIQKISAFYDQYFDRISSLPGAIAAGGIYPLPLSGEVWNGSFEIEHKTAPTGQPSPHASFAVINGNIFHALSIRLMEGRAFLRTDIRGNPSVAIVDEELARRYWPGESALGKRLDIIGATPVIWTTIVGVVSHIRTESLLEAGEPQIYLPATQLLQRSLFISVHTDAPIATVAATCREIARQIDADQPLAKIRPMQEVLDAAMARQRFHLRLLSLFALTALVLAATGIYGMMAFAVSQRTREIGLRMALGAQRRQVQTMILRNAAVLAIMGMALGTIAILLLRRVLASLLYNISSFDPAVVVSAWGLLAFVAFLASYFPARRAGRVDPAITLRHE